MSTLNKRIENFIYNEEGIQDDAMSQVPGYLIDGLKKGLRLLLLEQDRITREACCTLINNLPTSTETGGCLEVIDTQEALMNYQGGIK